MTGLKTELKRLERFPRIFNAKPWIASAQSRETAGKR
jgi:hypothetical protein